ncbi:hypothetical protein OG373_38115 [Streptomyces avidinii]|uniref:hypothetical protein n=1 Tax=Streptomyces avidinii TaxID=1895 RepID=UPI003870BE87|nr:hypothetical protein OG373_38115 [Streptomyces avidinii]
MFTIRTRRFIPLVIVTTLATGGTFLSEASADAAPAAAPALITPDPEPTPNTELLKKFIPPGSKIDKIKRQLYLYTYAFGGDLNVAALNLSAGHPATIQIKRYNGEMVVNKTKIAKLHPSHPGGTIFVRTHFSWPCAPNSANNGYIRAYDHRTGTWSKKLHVPLCQPID